MLMRESRGYTRHLRRSPLAAVAKVLSRTSWSSGRADLQIHVVARRVTRRRRDRERHLLGRTRGIRLGPDPTDRGSCWTPPRVLQLFGVVVENLLWRHRGAKLSARSRRSSVQLTLSRR